MLFAPADTDESAVVGKSLGHYEIREPLGSGGMGDVYRAHDTTLNRDVAIKVLPEDLADDSDRLARLKREAHLLAALNHPNVATIHGFEESDGTRFLVMELVKGESLEQRLAAGRLPVDEALDMCRQIAEALEAAHEEGIIHRDLKPANVLITPEGRAKVLDFGLAKTVEAVVPEGDMSHSPTVTVAGTQTGVILGTAPYMSPEQVRGKPLDKRADIWAFGCVLYETLTGSRAFNRETVVDTLAAILEVDPPWDALPGNTPVIVRSLLLRCLRKDPRRRLRDIGDARIEIEEATVPAPEIGLAGATIAIPTPDWTVLTRMVAVVVAAIALVAGGLAGTRFAVSPARRPEALQIELPEPMLRASIGDNHIAVSPSGRDLVYVAGSDATRFYIVHRPLDRFEHIPINGSEGMALPFFSPDGSKVGFSGRGAMKVAALDGGEPVTICEDCTGGAGTAAATWSPTENTIVFEGPNGSLWQVPATSGEPTLLQRADSESSYSRPSFLPDGRAVLVEIRRSQDRSNPAIGVFDLETKDLVPLVERGSNPLFVDSGHIVYYSDRSLYAVAFDADRRLTRGEPNRLTENTLGQFGVSHDGLLAYVQRSAAPSPVRNSLVWVDRQGNPTPLASRPSAIHGPRLSPHADRIAVSHEGRIWIFEIATQTWQMLDWEGGYSQYPVWSLDGKRIIHAAAMGSVLGYRVFSVVADYASEPEMLFEHSVSVFPYSVSPSGQVSLHEIHGDGSRNIGFWPGAGSAPEFQRTTSFERSPMVSPNGAWVAFMSDRERAGEWEVYVAPFPGGGKTTKVSDGGGVEPQWARDGTALFYRNGAQMIALSVITSEPEFTFVEREVLFENATFVRFIFAPGYDVHPDGRFLMLQRDDLESDPQIGDRAKHISIITNWFEELKERVPTGGR